MAKAKAKRLTVAEADVRLRLAEQADTKAHILVEEG